MNLISRLKAWITRSGASIADEYALTYPEKAVPSLTAAQAIKISQHHLAAQQAHASAISTWSTGQTVSSQQLNNAFANAASTVPWPPTQPPPTPKLPPTLNEALALLPIKFNIYHISAESMMVLNLLIRMCVARIPGAAKEYESRVLLERMIEHDEP